MDNPKPGWQFDRSISLGHVLSMIMMACTAAGVFMSLNIRVTVLEERQAAQSQVDRAQEDRIREMGNEVKGSLKDIALKLDKLVERELNRGRG